MREQAQSGSAKPIIRNSRSPFNSGSRLALAAPSGATNTVSGSPSERKRLIMKGQSLFDGWRPVRQQIFWKRARQRGALTGGSM